MRDKHCAQRKCHDRGRCEGRRRCREDRHESDWEEEEEEEEEEERHRRRNTRRGRHDEYADLMWEADLTGTVIGVPKHVFKVRETTKLILFAGAAIMFVVALDMSTKMISSAAAVACAKKRAE